MSKYILKIVDENGNGLARHELNHEGVQLVLAAVHQAALDGKATREHASAEPEGVTSTGEINL